MSLLTALRTHTRQAHEALHSHPLLIGLSPAPERTLSLTDFHHILLAFDAYYTKAEAACTVSWPDHVPNAPVLAWLASDLAQQQLESWADDIALRHPLIDTPSKLAGYMYTKQGSTLGGHVISKHLEKQLSLIPHIDQWFFAGYHHDNGDQWKRFVEVLETTPGLDPDQTVIAANQAFTHIHSVCDAVMTLRNTFAQRTSRHTA